MCWMCGDFDEPGNDDVLQTRDVGHVLTAADLVRVWSSAGNAESQSASLSIASLSPGTFSNIDANALDPRMPPSMDGPILTAALTAPELLDRINSVSYATVAFNTSVAPKRTLTYQFETAMPADQPAAYAGYTGQIGFTEAEKIAFRNIVAEYEMYLNIDLAEQTGIADADISLQHTNLESNYGGRGRFVYSGNGSVYDGWSLFQATISLATPSQRGLAVHEIGHALALKHPGNYDINPANAPPPPYLSAAEDNNKYSVMSYNLDPATGLKADRLMIYDVAALQSKWGANLGYNAGDTVYTAPSVQRLVLWDGGGDDTLDATSTGGAVTLKLTAGDFSSMGGVENLVIAYGAVIENATGGASADTLVGNDVANVLNGAGGNDTMDGGAGNDRLNGGSGFDRMSGGAGDDVIFYDAADNLAFVLGGADTDTLVFTSGAAPTTFDLTAHQFEKAEGRFSDPGGNAWTSYVDNYDIAWRKTHQTGLMDSGQTYFEDYDELGTETWVRITYWNDSLARPDVETGQLDDGRVYDSDIDNGNLYAWTRIDYWRDALGRSDVETGYLDDGRTYNSDLDNGDAFVWFRIDNWADSLGRLDYQNGVYDADDATRPGWTWQVDYDQANEFAWARVERFWNSAGVLQSEVFIP